MLKCLNNKSGFTLIELLVVISIITIMASVAVSNYSDTRNSKSLSLAAKQVENDLRNARSYSRNALKLDDKIPDGGYGVHFEKDLGYYIIFADDNADKDYNGGDGEEYERIDFPSGITIEKLEIDSVGVSSADVVFSTPYGIVFINGSDAPDKELEIFVEGSAGSRIISINTNGSIN